MNFLSSVFTSQKPPADLFNFIEVTDKHTLKDFLSLAQEALKSDPLGQKPFVHFAVDKIKPLGPIFAEAVKSMLLPQEIKNAEERYHISLASIGAQKGLKISDILHFSTQVADSSDKVMRSVCKGVYDPEASEFEKYQATHYNETSEERKSIRERLGSILENSINTSFKLMADIKRVSLVSQVMTVDQFIEVLTKKFALGFLEEGMHIPLPQLKDPETGEIHTRGYFCVEKIIKANGLMAFALVPYDAPKFIKPTLLFRPTTTNLEQENALESVADDMCNDIGKRSYDLAKNQLQKLIEDPLFLPKELKAHICGFSLGGAHAARMLADFPEKFEKATFFNDPSTEQNVSEKFIENLQHSSHDAQNPLEINIYHTDKDIVTQAGSVHIGYIDEAHKELRSKCKVLFKKILTFKTSEDENETMKPTLFGLFYKKERDSLKTKASIHTDLVLHLSDEDPSNPSTPRSERSLSDASGSNPGSPRSPSAFSIPVSPKLLRRIDSDNNILEKHRLNLGHSRTIYFALARISQFFINLGKGIKKIGKRFVRLFKRSDSHDRDFMNRCTAIYGRFKKDVQEFLSVPPLHPAAV